MSTRPQTTRHTRQDNHDNADNYYNPSAAFERKPQKIKWSEVQVTDLADLLATSLDLAAATGDVVGNERWAIMHFGHDPLCALVDNLCIATATATNNGNKDDELQQRPTRHI